VFSLLQPLTLLAQARPTVEFSLKPHLCVLAGNESECKDRLVVEWKNLRAEDISPCLYQEQASEPLFCWQKSQVGRTEFKASLTKTTTFELRTEQQQLLAREVFEVIYTRKSSRHSRRNPWSFF
jgi:hypothetical protein